MDLEIPADILSLMVQLIYLYFRSTTVFDEDVAIHLIDIDPNSPYRGERIPPMGLSRRCDQLAARTLLSLAPVWGFPLRPSTLYAAVLTTDLAMIRASRFWTNEEAWTNIPDTTMSYNLALANLGTSGMGRETLPRLPFSELKTLSRTWSTLRIESRVN